MMPAIAELLYPLAALMAEEPFKLVIMDSVSANMRVDYTGRGAFSTVWVPNLFFFSTPGKAHALLI